MTMFATTLGVLLALFLSNFNTSMEKEDNKEIAILNLNLEFSSNIKTIRNSRDNNDSILNFLLEIQELDIKLTEKFSTTSLKLNTIAERYPKYITIVDSISISNTNPELFTYTVAYNFPVNSTTVDNIAWEAVKINNTINEFSYECLKSLMAVYDTQELYNKAQRKNLEYYTEAEYYKLMRNLSINKGINEALIKQIEKTIDELKNCG